jgi:hypothetical protein
VHESLPAYASLLLELAEVCGFGLKPIKEVGHNTLCKRSEELTPNNPSASRKELSQADISSKISSLLRYRFKKGRLLCLIKKWRIASKDLVMIYEKILQLIYEHILF